MSLTTRILTCPGAFESWLTVTPDIDFLQALEETQRDSLDHGGKRDGRQQSKTPRVEGEALQHHAPESLCQGGKFLTF